MDWVNIRVDSGNKHRIKTLLKNKSYNNVIDAMLDYFEITGIKPHDTQKSPVSIVKSSMDNVLSVIRGIERKQSRRFNSIETQLEYIQDEREKEVISIEEKNILIDKMDSLSQETEEKTIVIQALQKKVSELSQELEKDTSAENNNIQLRKLLNELKKEIITSRIDMNNYQVKKHLFDNYVYQVDELIKN